MIKRILFFPLALLLSAGTFSTAAYSGQTATGKETSKVTKLEKIDQKPGTGLEADAGNEVLVHYTGWLYDEAAPQHHGKKFDSSLDRGQPLDFMLGEGQVIKGWDQGIAGMKVGGQRTLIIPANLGYGARGKGKDIPPNAALVFDVELLNVQ